MSRTARVQDFKRACMWALEPVLFRGEGAQAETVGALRKARLGILPEWYVVSSYVAAAVAAVVLAVGTLGVVAGLGLTSFLVAVLLGAGAGFAGFLLVRLGFLLFPQMRASARARRIDQEFASVVTLCYALARGGVGMVNVFRTVAEERDTYGEIAQEFALVIQDMESFGLDPVDAIETVSRTTPSDTLKAFFSGLVTVVKSGADPRDYFKRQAEMQLAEAERRMERELEQASLLAEVYVSGLLVLPLLLLVVLSVLSTIGTAGVVFIPVIVFALIPLGTLAYLVLVDTIMPSPPLTLPRPKATALDDFGMDTVKARHATLPRPQDVALEGPGSGMHLDGKVVSDKKPEKLTERVARALRRGTRRILTNVRDAAVAAAAGAVAMALAGFLFLTTWDVAGTPRLIATGGVTVGVLAVAAAPIAAFHEARISRARRLEKDLPDVLGRLASFNDRGVNLQKSLAIVGRQGESGLNGAFRTVAQDVEWSGHLGMALRRLRARVASRRVMKLSVLFERASRATGDLKEVLAIAAEDASKTATVEARKRQAMLSYVVVIYVVFAVFLYVIVMIARLFHGGAFQASGPFMTNAAGAGGLLSPEGSYFIFQTSVLIQGGASGFVAGKLGSGYVSSGLKHAVILAGAAWLAFTVGVAFW